MLKIVEEAAGADVRTLALDTGEVVELSRGPAGSSLRLLSKQGCVIFAYDPQTGRARVEVPKGDLEIATAEGDIDLRSARDIHLRAERQVTVESPLGIRLAAGDAASGNQSAVELAPGRLKLGAALVSLLGQRADLRLGELRLAGERLRATWRESKVTVEQLDIVAGKITERAKSVYQTIEGLWQTRAGRGRATFVGSFQQLSQDLFLKARRDAKLDGRKVHLG